MIRLTRDGDGFAVTEEFRLPSTVCGSQIHQPLWYEGHLYIPSNTNERNHGMMCMTPAGEVVWQTSDDEAMPIFAKGHLMMADGLIIAIDDKEGVLHLVAPSPEGYVELARAGILSGKQLYAPMALSDGRLLMRDAKEIKCLDLRGP